MRNRAKQKNTIQNLMIFMLCISTLFLIYKAVFGANLNVIIGNALTDEDASNISFVSNTGGSLAVLPSYILVTSADGYHYAEKKGSLREELFDSFAAILGEALGSAKEPKRISEDAWESLLQGEGVFIDYIFPQPIVFLSSSIGTECPDFLSDVIARRIFLSVSGSNLYICFIDETTDEFFRCETASNSASLSSAISASPEGEAKFAFEYGDEYPLLDPLFIFTNSDVELPLVTVSNLIGSIQVSDTLLSYFGINVNTSLRSDRDGSEVYVEGDRTLRFDSDGRILFSTGSAGGIPLESDSDKASINDAILNCANIIDSVFSYYGIDASLGITDIDADLSPDSCSISFGQFIDGVPLNLSGENKAAVFKISGGSLVRIEIFLHNYNVSPLDKTSPLPEKQAVSIISGKGEPVLMYSDDGSANTTVKWILLP